MMWTEEQIVIGKQLHLAIRRKQHHFVSNICQQNPWIITDRQWTDRESWLNPAVYGGDINMVTLMLDIGYNIDSLDMPEHNSALASAIDFNHFEIVKLLLQRGANPNLGRPTIGMINSPHRDRQREIIGLLVEHGADINRLYEIYGDKNHLMSALDFAGGNEDLSEYLASIGAKSSEQLLAESGRTLTKPGLSQADSIIKYFEANFGPVHKKSLIEIVPTGLPITLHVILPTKAKNVVTFFTTGMSDRAMTVPDGQEEFQYAELFIQLPGDWPLAKDKLAKPEFSWPLTVLRNIARYPHDNDTWLGGPVTLIANDDPPQPYHPSIRFTTMMLVAQHVVDDFDGTIVQLYRAIPLFTEERDLEVREGYQALFSAFDQNGIGFAMDLKRKNVGKMK